MNHNVLWLDIFIYERSFGYQTKIQDSIYFAHFLDKKYKHSWKQCRINHMAEAAYATGPALLGAPRLLSSIFSRIFLFHFSVRDQNSAPVRGPKEPKSPRKREGPKI
jgi:hypothetical protein